MFSEIGTPHRRGKKSSWRRRRSRKNKGRGEVWGTDGNGGRRIDQSPFVHINVTFNCPRPRYQGNRCL